MSIEGGKMGSRTAATIHTSDSYIVKSENTGKEFQIKVGLPPSYDHNPEASFPVVYVMDGNLLFEIATGIARGMQLGNLIPEIVVVSVGYPLESFHGNDFYQFFVRRACDLTSVVDERYENFVRKVVQHEDLEVKTGGGRVFPEVHN
jgi:hypothetical protein